MKKYNLTIFHQGLAIPVMQVGEQYHSRRNAYTATMQDGRLVAAFSHRLKKEPAPALEEGPAALDYPGELVDEAPPAELSWLDRYKRMKRELGLSDEKISQITGNTRASISAGVNHRNREFPRNLRLAIVVHEIHQGHRDHTVVI